MSRDDRSGRKNGRPLKGEPPRVPYEELDRVLVFGEVVTCEDGKNTTVHYPSYRDLARRFSVSHSLVAQYSKKHDCMRRRAKAQARITARADQKLVELRADAIALSKDDALRIIDGYLAGFETALAEGRVRFDNPGDFNTMLRLKEFLQGGADSRQEVHASLSLEDIQSRHQQMLRAYESSPAVRGEVPKRLFEGRGVEPGLSDRVRGENHPALPSELPTEEVTGHQVDGVQERARAAGQPPGAPACATSGEVGEAAPAPAREAQRAPAAPTPPHVRDPRAEGDEP